MGRIRVEGIERIPLGVDGAYLPVLCDRMRSYAWSLATTQGIARRPIKVYVFCICIV